MPTITPCVRASLPPSNANCSNGGASPRSSRHAWPASASSKASTIPPGGTPPWGIARPFATNRRCKQTDSPPPPEPSTKSGQLHCSMVAVPSLEEEDAKRPSRERESLVGERTRIGNRVKSALARLGIRGFKPGLRKSQERLEQLRTPEGVPLPPNTLAELRRDLVRLRFINEQIGQIEAARAERLRQQPDQARHPMILLLARVIGIGIETADMLVQEVLSRKLRDRRAVARYGGLTGSPEESGARRREKGLAKAGNARVRHGMLQLAWRFLMFQKDSSLAQWYRARTADARGATRKTMIVALARKLLVALWKLVTTGELPNGVVLRPAIPAAV